MTELIRCFGNTPLYIDYHDNEWGRPVHDDDKLYEMLVLEGMQAGLSWATVLNKREAFRAAFDGFDPRKAALYGDEKIQELMANEGIIRNRLKILAAIVNARLFLEVAEKYGSFDKFIWGYVDYCPITGHWESINDMPASTRISDKISKDLKKMGFKFVGTTIIYSFMQAVGMVNDHFKECFVYEEIEKARSPKITDNVAYIIRQIRSITGEKPGKTALQRFFYLVQAEGIDLGLKYGVHCYGPYSEALDAAVSLLAKDGIILVERKGSSQLMDVDGSYIIESDFGKETEAKLASVIEKYKENTPSELGLLTTTHYVRQKSPGLDLPGTALKVQKIVGGKCSEEVIDEVIKNLNS